MTDTITFNNNILSLGMELLLERIGQSEDGNIKAMFEDGNIDTAEMNRILDANQDGYVDLSDLSRLNSKLKIGGRISWHEFAGLFGLAPQNLKLEKKANQAELSGKIVYIKQMHKDVASLNRYLRARDFGYKVRGDKKKLQEAAQRPIESQKRIHEHLKEVNARHIFEENRYQDCYVDKDGLVRRFLGEKLKPSTLKKRLNTDSLKAYSVFGAATLYLTDNPEAALHAVTSPKSYERTMQQIEDLRKRFRNKQVNKYQFRAELDAIHFIRELELQQSVELFLAENPGETVYIIFGAYHDLLDNFRAARNNPDLEYEEVDLSGWDPDAPER